MLIDPEFVQLDIRRHLLLEMIGGADPSPDRVREGVYEIRHFGFDNFLAGCHNTHVPGPWDEYPAIGPVLGEINGRPFCEYNSYGVCDSIDQFFEHELGKWIVESERKFVASFSKITNSKDCGWRWHKWGPYIGKREPAYEYLRDQPEIEYVYCYHVHEFVEGKDSCGSRQWG